MSKAYTEADISDQMSQDRTWRLKEISDLKDAAKRADSGLQRALLRSMTPICYAHFEGHVRFAARKYLEYVALRKLRYEDLIPQFQHNLFLPRLDALSVNRTSVAQRCELIEEILNASSRQFSRPNQDLVNTKSNLSFEVLRDICLVCGVSSKGFDDKADFLDILLLKRRNEIAHGEETFLDFKDLDELTDGTIGLMRAFGDALENQVYLKLYKSARAAQPLTADQTAQATTLSSQI